MNRDFDSIAIDALRELQGLQVRFTDAGSLGLYLYDGILGDFQVDDDGFIVHIGGVPRRIRSAAKAVLFAAQSAPKVTFRDGSVLAVPTEDATPKVVPDQLYRPGEHA